MSAYYNEHDPFAAEWLRGLIRAGLIAPGHVDERDIRDVQPSDLAGYVQCHFFAGIGGWSAALRLAGWDDARPVWTGSCPCQPWSGANVWQGGGRGPKDSRDLWPDFRRLIAECRPPALFGEQVADAIRWGWLDRAFVDLEGEGYACGAAVLPASAVGADHQRRRLYFVADADSSGREGYQPLECVPLPASSSRPVNGDALAGARHALAGDYSDLLPCDGLSVVMERRALRGYGNAIVPQVAAEFVRACA